MYIWENDCMHFNFLDSDFVDWPLVTDTLNNFSLYFFIGLSSWTLCAKILVFLNSTCWLSPSSSICLNVDTTSSPMTSYVPNWINSFESSTMKGFSSCSISFDTLSAFLLKFSWKAGESSWWLYFECSFPLRTVKSSNSEITLVTSRLQICQRRNMYLSSLKPTKPPSPKKQWERIRVYSDTLVAYAQFPSAVNNSVLSLYSTKHINILYLSINKARFYVMPLGILWRNNLLGYP